MLPKVLLQYAASFLDAQAVAHLGSSCTQMWEDVYTDENTWRELSRRLLSTGTGCTLAPLRAGITSARHFFVQLNAVAGTEAPRSKLANVDAIRYVATASHNVIDPTFIQREDGTYPLREESSPWYMFHLHETSVLEWVIVQRFLGEEEDRFEDNALCREELFNAEGEQLILHLPGDSTVYIDFDVLQAELEDFGVDFDILDVRDFLLHDLGDVFCWEFRNRVRHLLVRHSLFVSLLPSCARTRQ